jgi:hypothetical protein
MQLSMREKKNRNAPQPTRLLVCIRLMIRVRARHDLVKRLYYVFWFVGWSQTPPHSPTIHLVDARLWPFLPLLGCRVQTLNGEGLVARQGSQPSLSASSDALQKYLVHLILCAKKQREEARTAPQNAKQRRLHNLANRAH